MLEIIYSVVKIFIDHKFITSFLCLLFYFYILEMRNDLSAEIFRKIVSGIRKGYLRIRINIHFAGQGL